MSQPTNNSFEEKHDFSTSCKHCQFEKGHSLECKYYKEVPMPKLKPSEIFEGKNSSLRKTFDEAVRLRSFEEKLNEVIERFLRRFFYPFKDGGFGWSEQDSEGMIQILDFIFTALTQCREETIKECIEALPKEYKEKNDPDLRYAKYDVAIGEFKQSLLNLTKL